MIMQIRRKATNLSIREDVMEGIRKHNLNASQIAEESLAAAVRAAERQKWLDENAEAIDHFNERAERGQLFNKTFRRF
jgi:antitoxin CcdA